MNVRHWPLVVLLLATSALAAPVPDSVRESDAAAQPMLQVLARFAPEGRTRAALSKFVRACFVGDGSTS